jgi:hypothetical protein
MRSDDPLPVTPPTPCPHPLMWRLARGLLETHVRDAAGLCCLCGLGVPCPAQRLGRAGLQTARGHADGPAGAAWLDVVRHRLSSGVVGQRDLRLARLCQGVNGGSPRAAR